MRIAGSEGDSSREQSMLIRRRFEQQSSFGVGSSMTVANVVLVPHVAAANRGGVTDGGGDGGIWILTK